MKVLPAIATALAVAVVLTIIASCLRSAHGRSSSAILPAIAAAWLSSELHPDRAAAHHGGQDE
jgi:hypothetical protein